MKLIPTIEKNEIQKRISQVAEDISSDYAGRDLVMVGVLKGAFIFLADLARQLTLPLSIDFIQVSSYGDALESSGNITVKQDIGMDIQGRHALLVEDIIDTGATLSFLVERMKSRGAASVKTCVLVDKRERRKTGLKPDYTCHVIEKGFLVGYGLDYGERFRNLPDICRLIEQPGAGQDAL
ncbi:Hypoxanthine-guanine phosphoribosyltransferase [Candidatus Desulfarcum epimagneticum]|uniref:Hypoxanthine phosphoribosyltransferase n=1 Tax=uncultured Desulfobacteraceae bacterium TaxID=218296 RepID=A0A484HLU4_9BACT|nr:Hypoxanthine-guanine phosphoribosyltransferase [uncultured Desulfobacteraceae bacterium]